MDRDDAMPSYLKSFFSNGLNLPDFIDLWGDFNLHIRALNYFSVVYSAVPLLIQCLLSNSSDSCVMGFVSFKVKEISAICLENIDPGLMWLQATDILVHKTIYFRMFFVYKTNKPPKSKAETKSFSFINHPYML
jgi:hypothetical protein